VLTIPEEILLLVMDEQSGRLLQLPHLSMEFALAGAVLMELAFRQRIDSDASALFVTDPAPTGDPLLDPSLADIVACCQPSPAGYWVRRIACQADHLRDQLLARLVARGILRVEEERFLWLFHARRYPLINDREITEVRARLRALLFDEPSTVPEPADIAIIGLAHACSLFDQIYTVAELDPVRPRIEQIVRMELLGRAVVDAVRETRDIELMTLHYARALGR
jgi:golgi phosphoprotein 3